ncbi:cysteine-rich KTR domain-containing protein [Eubacteriales bacterium DFI.9.88]|nr:cysteine-rich KTR domain-containing protein [Eubacteriales bacterium DFI.9.88]
MYSNKYREEIVRKNSPLYCPKCKQETLINVKELYITVIKEPDALDAEPMNL